MLSFLYFHKKLFEQFEQNMLVYLSSFRDAEEKYCLSF